MGLFGAGGIGAHIKKLLNPKSIIPTAKGYVGGLATTGNPYAAIAFAAKADHDWAVDQQDKDRGLGKYAPGASPQTLEAARQQRQADLDKYISESEQASGAGGSPSHSPYSHNYNPNGGLTDMYGTAGSGNLGTARPGPYQGSYFQEGDPEGMFRNEDGGHDWVAGTGPSWLKNSAQYGFSGKRPIGRRPPLPDSVAERDTTPWKQAYDKEQSWIQQNLDAGRTLHDLGEDPTRGGGLSNYMKWGSYQPNLANAPQDPGIAPHDNPVYPGHPISPTDVGGGGPTGYGVMNDYAGPDDVYGNSETGGDYGLARMYQGLLGNKAQSGAFLAPQTQALQEQKDGQIQSIMASIPPGGQRDRALAQLDKSFNASLSGMRQGLLSSSLTGLQGLYGTQLGDATQRYGIDTQADTSRYATDAQRETALGQLGLGYANLGQQGYQFDTNLDWSKNQFGQNFGLEKAKYLTDADQWNQLFNRQGDWRTQDQSNAKYNEAANTISGLASAYLATRNGGGGGGGFSSFFHPQQNRVRYNNAGQVTSGVI